MFATINVIEFGFSDRVIDIDARAEQLVFLFEFVKTSNSSSSFFGDTLKVFREFAEVMFILRKIFIDCFVQPVFIFRVSSSRLNQSLSLVESLFSSETFNQVDGRITSVINNLIRTLSVTPVKTVVGKFPILLKRLSFPGKNGCSSGFSNGGSSMILS